MKALLLILAALAAFTLPVGAQIAADVKVNPNTNALISPTAANFRSANGFGTMATQAASNVAITGGSLTDIATLTGGTPVFDGVTFRELPFGLDTLTIGGSGSRTANRTLGFDVLDGNRIVTIFGSTTLPVLSQAITFTGPTAARTITLPDSDFAVASTDVAQTFNGENFFADRTFLDGGLSASEIDVGGALVITSTTRALTLPRMTKAQRDALDSPIAGMVVYQNDNTPGLRVYNGTNWMRYTEMAD